jgi:hypothetical protein
MCLGEPAKNASRAKKANSCSLGKRIEVRAKCRQVRNSVETAIYEPVVIMQFPEAAPQPCPRPANRGEGDLLLKSAMTFTTPSKGARKTGTLPADAKQHLGDVPRPVLLRHATYGGNVRFFFQVMWNTFVNRTRGPSRDRSVKNSTPRACPGTTERLPARR